MTELEKILERAEFSELEAYYRLGYDSEQEPGVKHIINGARGEHNVLMPIIRALCEVIKGQREALQQYSLADDMPFIAEQALDATDQRLKEIGGDK